MNERIRELGLQAAACTVNPNSAFTAEEFMSFQEKFAELIIKECVVVLRDYDVDYVEDVLQEHLGDAE